VSAHKSAHRPSHQAGDHVPIRLLPQAAAEAGEPPGTWWGPGAERLGLAEGRQVELEPYNLLFGERKGPDGLELARAPANDGKAGEVLQGHACG